MILIMKVSGKLGYDVIRYGGLVGAAFNAAKEKH